MESSTSHYGHASSIRVKFDHSNRHTFSHKLKVLLSATHSLAAQVTQYHKMKNKSLALKLLHFTKDVYPVYVLLNSRMDWLEIVLPSENTIKSNLKKNWYGEIFQDVWL